MSLRLRGFMRHWVPLLVVAAGIVASWGGGIRGDEKGGAPGAPKAKSKDGDSKDKGKDGDSKEKGKAKAKDPAPPGPKGEGEDPAKPADGPDDSEKKPPKPGSIDEEYVRDNLKSYLNPTEMEVLDDGRTHLVFDLSAKSHEQDLAFTPNISSVLDNSFRWTVEGDEEWETSTTSRSTYPKISGVKASNAGLALVNCWFLDDVEVEADFALTATFSKKHTFALVFSTDAQQALGNNAGTQCTTFKKGKPVKVQGIVEPLVFRNSSKLRLKVKGGTFEAAKDKRARQKMKYEPREYASGRVGFLWAGGVGGIISRMEIVGKVDWKRMAKELREKGPK